MDEKMPWMFHLMAVHGGQIGTVSYETDRMRFLGRGNGTDRPQAMQTQTPLSDSSGSVLDPIVAIRTLITLEPEQTATIDMVTGVGDSRDICQHLIENIRIAIWPIGWWNCPGPIAR